jgi:hypothetical protein
VSRGFFGRRSHARRATNRIINRTAATVGSSGLPPYSAARALSHVAVADSRLTIKDTMPPGCGDGVGEGVCAWATVDER